MWEVSKLVNDTGFPTAWLMKQKGSAHWTTFIGEWYNMIYQTGPSSFPRRTIVDQYIILWWSIYVWNMWDVVGYICKFRHANLTPLSMGQMVPGTGVIKHSNWESPMNEGLLLGNPLNAEDFPASHQATIQCKFQGRKTEGLYHIKAIFFWGISLT